MSWGSVLGPTYAERHADRVLGVVLAAVSLGRAEDIDWLTLHAGRFFPAEWRAFHDHIPERLRDERLVDAYTRSSWTQTRRSATRPPRRGATGSPPTLRPRQRSLDATPAMTTPGSGSASLGRSPIAGATTHGSRPTRSSPTRTGSQGSLDV